MYVKFLISRSTSMYIFCTTSLYKSNNLPPTLCHIFLHAQKNELYLFFIYLFIYLCHESLIIFTERSCKSEYSNFILYTSFFLFTFTPLRKKKWPPTMGISTFKCWTNLIHQNIVMVFFTSIWNIKLRNKLMTIN